MAQTINANLPFATTASERAPQATSVPLSRFFSWLISARRIDALIDSRQRLAEREIARYLARQGADRLTDGMERDIARLL